VPDELRDLLRRVDAVPEWVLELGRAAGDMRTMDAELARLELDSLQEPAGTVRAGDETRMLSFSGERLRLELEVTGASIRGQLVPEAVAVIALESGTGEAARTESDADGRFVIQHAGSGLARLRVEAGGAALVTDWIIL
jgi:hypothetical protein